MKTSVEDIKKLEELYAGRKAYHGELHDHSNSYGTSDGMRTLTHWKGAMEALKVDFAAILDHKQVLHMYSPAWSDGLFVGGTEPGTAITDADAEVKKMHYNMIFENAEPLMELLSEFPEYNFTGGPEGHFDYPEFTRERFGELIDSVFAHGGFFVHPHPKQLMKSDDPLQYYFRDGMGIEVVYEFLDGEKTKENYKLWRDLLRLGKKVYATAGCDLHECCHDTALTTIYAEQKKNSAYIRRLREGDFTCGPVGIRACINDTRMGGTCDFENQKFTICVSDFHRSVYNPEHKYRLDIINDRGNVKSFKLDCKKPFYASVKTEKNAKYYFAELTDLNSGVRIAIANPIWNKE